MKVCSAYKWIFMQTYFHMKAFARRLVLKHKAQSNLEMGYLKELQKSNHDQYDDSVQTSQHTFVYLEGPFK